MMKEADFQPPVEAREAGRPRWSTASATEPSATTPAPPSAITPDSGLIEQQVVVRPDDADDV
jgi:hypothetical protein